MGKGLALGGSEPPADPRRRSVSDSLAFHEHSTAEQDDPLGHPATADQDAPFDDSWMTTHDCDPSRLSWDVDPDTLPVHVLDDPLRRHMYSFVLLLAAKLVDDAGKRDGAHSRLANAQCPPRGRRRSELA